MTGETVSTIHVGADGYTPAGSWDIYFADIAIVGADGTVHPLYNGGSSVNLNAWGSSGSTRSYEVNHWQGAGPYPNASTNYYHQDHLGTSRLMTSYGGYPIWQGTFMPFGEEVNPQITTNHYKFTGDEHDAEDNTEHTQFRQLSSVQGRWLSPDPYLGSMDLTNPQSLNRYAYVMNNPMRYSDPLGLWHCVDSDGGSLDEFTTESDCTTWGGGWTPDPGDIPGDPSLTFNGNQQSDPGTQINPGDLQIDPNSITSLPLNNSGDQPFEQGSLAYSVFQGSASTWAAADGTVNDLAVGYSVIYGSLATAATAPGIIAQGIGRAYALGRAGTVVLGSYPAYVNLAKQLGAKAFDMPNFLYRTLDFFGEAWTANQAFLDQAIQQGNRIVTTGIPQNYASSFYLEIQYLASRGLILNPSTLTLSPVR